MHHIICRGIERKPIFLTDADRDDFVTRFETILAATETRCYAWALIPNHFHLLLQTGPTPISTVMRRLLTGYAVAFNLRHKRSGHLFQNRYKSIICQDDLYLFELIRYIHLYPLRAGLVSSLAELATYPWCGHRQLLKPAQKGVLAQAEEQLTTRERFRAAGFGLDGLAQYVSELLGFEDAASWARGKPPRRVLVRSFFCFWAVRELGYTATALATRFGISQPAVSLAVQRGETLAATQDYPLPEMGNL